MFSVNGQISGIIWENMGKYGKIWENSYWIIWKASACSIRTWRSPRPTASVPTMLRVFITSAAFKIPIIPLKKKTQNFHCSIYIIYCSISVLLLNYWLWPMALNCFFASWSDSKLQGERFLGIQQHRQGVTPTANRPGLSFECKGLDVTWHFLHLILLGLLVVWCSNM